MYFSIEGRVLFSIEHCVIMTLIVRLFWSHESIFAKCGLSDLSLTSVSFTLDIDVCLCLFQPPVPYGLRGPMATQEPLMSHVQNGHSEILRHGKEENNISADFIPSFSVS